MNKYLALIKPGIICGNLLTFAAGFALARPQLATFGSFLLAALGLAAVIAGACACNNYIDRRLDAQMVRTRGRPLVTGALSSGQAIGMGLALLGFGGVLLWVSSGAQAAQLALLGFLVYVFPYSLLKTRTPHATLIGSISGAIPPLVGYSAAAQMLNPAAWTLFALVFIWQMPHFYAIGLWRRAEYAAAGVPILPVIADNERTQSHIVAWTLALIPCVFLLSWQAGSSYLGAAVLLACSLIWLHLAASPLKADVDTQWGRTLFLWSLVVILVVSSGQFLNLIAS